MTDRGHGDDGFFAGQAAHLACLVVLLFLVWAAGGLPGVADGAFLGLSSGAWLWLAVLDAVAHQVYVWLAWRAELNGRHLTRRFGPRAFTLYAAGFTVLFVARPILAFALAWADRDTLPLGVGPGVAIAVLLCLPVIWLGVSIVRHFSFRRAFGIDHFDPAWRDAPLVREGIFRLTPNAMYVFGFLALWVPAFLFQSAAALVYAAFSHAYIWVHYYCTEKPDMRRIYGA